MEIRWAFGCAFELPCFVHGDERWYLRCRFTDDKEQIVMTEWEPVPGSEVDAQEKFAPHGNGHPERLYYFLHWLTDRFAHRLFLCRVIPRERVKEIVRQALPVDLVVG